MTGILQTERYARALFRGACPLDAPETTAEKVEGRLQRREVLDRDRPAHLWTVLDESCLRRMVGGPQVMREQLTHLAETAALPHVTIQVLPFDTGAPAADQSFTLLQFDDAPANLYTETLGVGRVIDSEESVVTADDGSDRLRADALSPEKSLDEICRTLEALPG
ncbi:DUF5753 domain-containing protein [Streptomyces sp. NPDC002537]